jgi:signal transduction histidine kinase
MGEVDEMAAALDATRMKRARGPRGTKTLAEASDPPRAPKTVPRRVRRARTAEPADGPTTPLADGGRLRARSRANAAGRSSRPAGAPAARSVQLPLALPEHGPSLARALAGIRRALLDRGLDEGLRATAQTLAAALAPAAVEVWLADQTQWIGEAGRAGGQELFPLLRLHAVACPGTPAATAVLPAARPPDALIEDVAATRRAVVLLEAEAAAHPLARAWLAVARPDGLSLGTCAAYPLQVRGQFLGVLAVGTATALGVEQLAMLEAVADQCALAAEHGRLLSYSRGQEALAQLVVRHAPMAVAALTGPPYAFALANPAFAQLLGVEESLVGQPLDAVIPEAAGRVREGLRLDAVIASGEPQAMIELPIHLDRGLTYWNVTCSPLAGRRMGRTGRAGVLVAAVDVTRQVLERQRALEAVEVAQERLGQMMALHATSLAVASQLGADPRALLDDILRRSIALLDARAGIVYVVHRRAGELEAIVCQGLRGDYVGSRVRIGEGLTGQVARTGQGLVVDDIRLSPVSPAIYAGEAVSAVIAVPLIHHGRVVGVLDVLDDADRRTFSSDDLWLLELFAAQAAQAIENARTYVTLERAYRAQRELDRLKDDFIATASHELRTPLTGVQGFLELLRDYPGSRDEPLAAEFLSKAAESAEELAELTERLLETSQLDAGQVELQLEPVHLHGAVEQVLRARSGVQAWAGSGHELVCEVPAEIYIRADRNRLAEVLDNLIGNAIKYSPQGGVVRISCAFEPGGGAREPGAADVAGAPSEEASVSLAAVPLADRPTAELDALVGPDTPAGPSQARVAAVPPLAVGGTPGYVVVTVSDQGMGIPTQERERLFERFARLDAARSSQIRGTGLGLHICRQLVEAMGGSIWLQESATGQGSTFAFALPLAAPAAAG